MDNSLSYKILRLTERALSLLESGHVDEALQIIDNRERAMNLLADSKNITPEDFETLKQVDSLNEQLLAKLNRAKEDVQTQIASTHHTSEAHKSYHSNRVK